MSIVTREIINKNIIFEDRNNFVNSFKKYNYDDLSKEIDKFKNIFLKYNAKKGNSAVIGIQPKIEQIACIFACIELGISIVIIDYHRPDFFQQYKYMDPKTEILLPIDFFIVVCEVDSDKYNFFKNKSRQTIVIDNETCDYTKNDKILADSDTEIIRCTSSGTTNTPKKVIHSHKFFYELIQRNSKFFDKTVALAFNLNHGSSIATYFLPSMISKKVQKIISVEFNADPNISLEKKLEFNNIDINHLLLPYKNYLEIAAENINPDTTFYTLSAIPNTLKEKFHKVHFKNIISFFGSNETSGPVLINKISYDNFSSEKYYKFDNFYQIQLKNQTLNVSLPVYKSVIDTNDLFEESTNNTFLFKGRNDFRRINGVNADVERYDEISKNIMNCDLIYDTVYQEIYLAIWESYTDIFERFLDIDRKIRSESSNCHYLDKGRILDKSEFLSGVKLDQELLREYFRQRVKKLNG